MMHDDYAPLWLVPAMMAGVVLVVGAIALLAPVAIWALKPVVLAIDSFFQWWWAWWLS